MVDFLKICIYFKQGEVLVSKTGQSSFLKDSLENIAKRVGLKLASGSVTFEINGDLEIADLRHPYEQLPSHFSTLAMKVWTGSDNLLKMPFVELKASPAKLLQAHNVFGPTNLELCCFEMLNTLAVAKPELYEMLDVQTAVVDWIDVTFSAHVESDSLQKQLISFLKNVQSGQTRMTRHNKDYETTVNWNSGSRRRTLKVYLKGYELQRKIDEVLHNIKRAPNRASLIKTLNILTDNNLTQFARKCVRFEARLMQRYLDDKKIPRRMLDMINFQKEYEKDGKNLIADLWKDAFKDVLNAIGESSMNVYNEEKMMTLLRKHYYSVTPKGKISYAKADRLYGFYERLLKVGYDNVYRTMDRATFKRHLDCLIAIGLTKAQLQNLKSEEKSNIIPLMKLVEIDFSRQYPDWYVEPTYSHLRAA